MPRYKPTLLLLATFLSVLTTSSQSSAPCSSLDRTKFSHKPTAKITEECIFHSQDSFSLTFSLPTSHLSFDFSAPQGKLRFDLQKTTQANDYRFQIITSNTTKTYTVSKSSDSLSLQMKDNTLTITFKNPALQLSHPLQGSSLYNLAIHASQDPLSLNENPFSTPKTSLRSLAEGCPLGFFLVDGKCDRVCPGNTYRNQGICSLCTNICDDGLCVSEKKCNPCKDGQVYWEESGTCHDKCPEMYFEDTLNRVCARCSEGCVSCSYPNGLCNGEYFKADFVINMTISVVLLIGILVCACCWNRNQEKEKPEEEQPNQQAQREPESASGKTKVIPNHLNKFMDGKPVGPYNVLPEGFELNDDDDEEGQDEFQGRRKKKRLTDFAQSKLLTISLAKPFEVDDSNEDRAIAHGSALLSRPLSATLMTSKAESPLFKTRRSGKKNSKLISNSGSRSEIQDAKSEVNPEDWALSPPQHSPREGNSPCNSVSVNKDSLSFMLLKNCGENLHMQLESKREEGENVRTVEEAEEVEEAEDEEEKRGYKPDMSMSMSKDKDGILDLNACTICGMNKRDCVNKPCGHVVGCYACMEQWKESYAVCPRCKGLIKGLERIKRAKK